MKRKNIKFVLLATTTFLLSLTFVQEEYYIDFNKKSFKKSDFIRGKVCINSPAMKRIRDKKDAGYGAFDSNYKLVSNAVQLKSAPDKKDLYSWDGYVLVPNAITVKEDTAFFSFKIPESLMGRNNTEMMQLRINRQWKMNGKDTTFVVIKQFKIFN